MTRSEREVFMDGLIMGVATGGVLTAIALAPLWRGWDEDDASVHD